MAKKRQQKKVVRKPAKAKKARRHAVPTFVGRHVLCRCVAAGVHVGTLVSLDGDRAVLANSRRLWYWKISPEGIRNGGVALSGLAQHGVDVSASKIDTTNPEISLTGVIEVIPTSKVAERSFDVSK